MQLIFRDAYLQVNLTFLITDKVYLSGKIKVTAGASKCLTLLWIYVRIAKSARYMTLVMMTVRKTTTTNVKKLSRLGESIPVKVLSLSVCSHP